jgi:hypothetical protein
MTTLQSKMLGKSGLSLFLAAIILVSFLFVTKALGQSDSSGAFNISTTPVVANLQTKPGVATTTKIQVRNNNLTAEHIKVSLLRFTSNNENGAPELINPEQNDEFLTWVKFSETKFDAEPNVWKTIDMTITPPDTAAFGYYYAAVFTRDDATTQTKVTNLTGAVAIPILLDVNAPGEVRKADITQFKSSRNVFEFLPATFTVELKNGGNTHVAPRGNVFITKGGKSVATLEVNQAKGNILPATKRQFSADWNDGTPVYKLNEVDGKVVLKDGRQTHKLDWSGFDLSKLRFGKYHAKVAMVYDDGVSDVSSEAELDFWVIPWRILGMLFVLILFIAAGLWVLVIRPVRKGIMKLPRNPFKKH